MSSTPSRLRTTLANLLLACINATLLLVLACLVMAYLLVQKFDGVAENIARSLLPLAPVREEIAALNNNLESLRSSVGEMRTSDPSNIGAVQLQSRVDGLQSELARINATIGGLSESPTDLVDHAVAETAEALVSGIREIRGCTSTDVADSSG
jgi:hypothetical protein